MLRFDGPRQQAVSAAPLPLAVKQYLRDVWIDLRWWAAGLAHRYPLRRILVWLAIGLGFWHIGAGVYIHVKAWVAQELIEAAWQANLGQRRAFAHPWRWADTTPVARIDFVRQHQQRIVLDGDSGRVLAFGPGLRTGSPRPGHAGNSVISGHRDTHFAVLEMLRIGDPIRIQRLDGRWIDYRVDDLQVVDRRALRVTADHGRDELTLVTCWPFDAIEPGGPGRYVVSAGRVG